MLIFFVCVPEDYEWTLDLAERLESEGYPIYLEPLEVDKSTRKVTTKALRKSSVMVAVISQDSALGENAAVFERWWRPYVENQRPIVGCLMPDAPLGAEHWMPHDLYRQNPIDFRNDNAYAQLLERLGAPPEPEPIIEAPPPQIVAPLEIAPQVEPEPQPEPLPQKPIAPPPMPASEVPIAPPRPQDIEESAGWFKTIFSIVIGLVLLIFIWVAAIGGGDDITLETWLALLFGGIGILFLMAYVNNRQKQRQRDFEYRRAVAKERGKTAQSGAYIEVIESGDVDEIGQVWLLEEAITSIGRGHSSTIGLTDAEIDKEHCVIFYEDGDYFLESTSHQKTMVVDRYVAAGTVTELQNGDLIALG